MGNPKAITYLTRGLRDPNSFVRSFSASSLGMFGDKRAIPNLKKSLQDPVVWVNNHAARALANLGDNTGIPLLIENLSSQVADKKNSASEEANDFLIEVTGQDFGYNPQGTKKERDEAQKKWQQWWETQ